MGNLLIGGIYDTEKTLAFLVNEVTRNRAEIKALRESTNLLQWTIRELQEQGVGERPLWPPTLSNTVR